VRQVVTVGSLIRRPKIFFLLSSGRVSLTSNEQAPGAFHDLVDSKIKDKTTIEL